MRIYQKLSLFLTSLVISFFLFASPIFAACDPVTEKETEIGCIPLSPGGFVGKFYGYFFGLIGGVAILYIIVGGYYILGSQGDPRRLQTGKSYITYAVIGLLLAIFGYAFIRIIAVDILRIPGFN